MYLTLVEKLEWRIDLTQIFRRFSVTLVPVKVLSKLPAIHDSRRHPRVIRSSFQRIVTTTYISAVSLGPPNVVYHGITMYWKQFSKVQNSTQRKRKRDREWTLEQSLTDSGSLCKNPEYLYWSANEQLALQRLSRRLSQVCESVWIHACRCVYANAARGFTLRRVSHIMPILDKQEAPVHPTLWMSATSFRLVATLDSGSLH